MSVESVRQFITKRAPDIEIVELDEDSSTYTLSTKWGIKPAQIAKSLVLRVNDEYILAVTCGDSRLDNKKVKESFGGKAKIVRPEQATELTGHAIGGVCPFGLATPLPIFFDIQLRQYDVVVPGAGSPRYALRIDPRRMAELVAAEWANFCQDS